MPSWRQVTLVDRSGTLRSPGQLVEELRDEPGADGVVLGGHRFGTNVAYAHLLCHHLARLGRPWAIEGALGAGDDPTLLRRARRSGCRALILAADPDPLLGDATSAAAALRRMRRAGLLTVVHLELGRPGA